jgi:hypothetical protein
LKLFVVFFARLLLSKTIERVREMPAERRAFYIRGYSLRKLVRFCVEEAIPNFAEVLVGPVFAVEFVDPCRHVGEIIITRNECPGLSVKPVSTVRGFAARQHGRAILERERDYFCFEVRCETHLIPDGCANQHSRTRGFG